MNVDLRLKDWVIDSQDLAVVVGENLLNQIGLTGEDDGIVICDEVLFESKIPEILEDTMIQVTQLQDTQSIILKTIQGLQEKYSKGAPYDLILSTISKDYNLDWDAVKKIMTRMVQNGLIYEAERGYYKSV